MKIKAFFCILIVSIVIASSGAEAKKQKTAKKHSGEVSGSAVTFAAAATAFGSIASNSAIPRVFLSLDDNFLNIVSDTHKHLEIPREQLGSWNQDQFSSRLVSLDSKNKSGASDISLYIQADNFDEIKSLIDGRKNSNPIYLVGENRTLKLKSITTNVENRFYLEYADNLWLPPDTLSNIKNIDRMFQQKFSSKNVHLVSFFDNVADTDTINALKKAGSNAAGIKIIKSQKPISNMFEGISNKVVIMVGHIENGKITILDKATNKTAEYATKDLMEAARRNNNLPVILGCESALIGNVGGFTCPVNSVSVANNIGRAIDSKTFGDFYKQLSGDSAMIVENYQLSRIGLVIEGAIVRKPFRPEKIGTRVAFWGSVQLSPTSRLIAWTLRINVLLPVLLLMLIFAVPWRWTQEIATLFRSAFYVPPLALIDWFIPVWIIWAPIVYPLLWLANLQYKCRQWLHRGVNKLVAREHA